MNEVKFNKTSNRERLQLWQRNSLCSVPLCASQSNLEFTSYIMLNVNFSSIHPSILSHCGWSAGRADWFFPASWSRVSCTGRDVLVAEVIKYEWASRKFTTWVWRFGDSRLFSRFLMHAAEVKRCATEVNIGAGRPATNDLFFCEKMINVFKMWEKKKWKESKVRSSKYLFIAWLTVRNPKILTWSLMSFLCSEDFLTFAIFFSIFTSLCIE